MILPLIILSIIGLVTIFYTIYAEYKAKQDPKYRSLCDFNKYISCTKTIKSPWERVLFGIPNSIVGIGYYFLIILLAFAGRAQFALYLALITSSLVLIVTVLMIRTEKVLCTICSLQWLIMLVQAIVAFQYL